MPPKMRLVPEAAAAMGYGLLTSFFSSPLPVAAPGRPAGTLKRKLGRPVGSTSTCRQNAAHAGSAGATSPEPAVTPVPFTLVPDSPPGAIEDVAKRQRVACEGVRVPEAEPMAPEPADVCVISPAKRMPEAELEDAGPRKRRRWPR